MRTREGRNPSCTSESTRGRSGLAALMMAASLPRARKMMESRPATDKEGPMPHLPSSLSPLLSAVWYVV